MRCSIEAMNHPEYQESVQATGEAYENWTLKEWMLEIILREQTGDFPAKFTEQFLATG
ncbi:hypothetical protein [Paenibacillus sp. XY044]|uniref:hypothetical protein n=1 Tax=Paenibacillus sp. XY044 TaxID=2026089 RepID=UPI0015C67471|nr:hypothetical protein [Paenibacillus sp. XY044]